MFKTFLSMLALALCTVAFASPPREPRVRTTSILYGSEPIQATAILVVVTDIDPGVYEVGNIKLTNKGSVLELPLSKNGDPKDGEKVYRYRAVKSGLPVFPVGTEVDVQIQFFSPPAERGQPRRHQGRSKWRSVGKHTVGAVQ